MDKRIREYLDEIIEVEQECIHYAYNAIDCNLSREYKPTPIEQLLNYALHHEKRFRDTDLEKHKIYFQYKLGKYRVDFLVRFTVQYFDGETDSCDVIVECDGHNFHEKTKEQAENDKSRDRALQGIGCAVLRFSGREIWRDPGKCAEQVFQYLTDQLYRQYKNRHQELKDVEAVK
jgi:very-short-patch-repair endonuclease